MFFSFWRRRDSRAPITLGHFWEVTSVSEDGLLNSETRQGFMFEADGLDGSFLSQSQLAALHGEWRSTLRLSPGEELQIVFRKRVEFSAWVEEQMSQAFLSDNAYGRRILLDRLSDQVLQMGQDEPRLLNQKIIVCFWSRERISDEDLREKRQLLRSQLSSFGFSVRSLDRSQIEKEISQSSRDLSVTESEELKWPSIQVEAEYLHVNGDRFRSLELSKLPETSTELGMIQSITALPFPLDLSVRLTARDTRPIASRLTRKRNLLSAQKGKRGSSPEIDSQIEQIDRVLRSLADSSESIFDLLVTVGLRFPKDLAVFHRKAMATIARMGAQMDFCDFDESTLGTFDCYLECIPGFRGKNIRAHTVMGSNAIHFLPFFRPSKGDRKPVITFQTTGGTLYGIDPVDPRLANYNWLVSGTSGAGKSFFVNSLIAQSLSMNPNVFIVDIGGSYNKLTKFLGGRVMSLEPGQGFELSPFFLSKSNDPNEERMRRQHVFQIFLEMTRIDGQLPPIEVRHVLSECLQDLFEQETLPERPISAVLDAASKRETAEANRLAMLLRPWSQSGFFGQFLDNNKVVADGDSILTIDLKGLTEFNDLARVVQLIVCSSLWGRIRRSAHERFSWIVLDEVAFSLLKTQPLFVDELVSTLRKYYAGAVIVVQDLEKITSNLAGASILQNTQSKAILQQRGDPKNYAEALSLSSVDLWAVESLRRENGVYSDAFLIRDTEKAVIRHVPSRLEYWLATTAPEDNLVFTRAMDKSGEGFQNFQKNTLDFVSHRNGAAQ